MLQERKPPMKGIQPMVDFKKLVEESEGPMDLKAARSKPLFDTDEEPSLQGISEKLIQAANVITDHKIAIALGLETNQNAIFFSGAETEWILARVEPMLKAVQQTKKIKADQTSDIIKLLEKGKLSIAEARSMIELINQKQTMELLSELE